MPDTFPRSFSGIPNPAGRPINGTRTLLAACAVTVLLYFIPYAEFLTYPIRMLVTFLHEGGHALMTLLTGGMVSSISIFPDGSGVTWSRGGIRFLITSSGYLGATLYGAALIYALRTGRLSGRTVLLATGVVIGLLTVCFVRPWGSGLYGFFWGGIIAAALVIGSRRLPEATAAWGAAFVGVQCVMNALFDLRTLFNLSLMPGAPQTDAVTLAKMTLIPAPVWAAFWIALALGMLFFVLRPARGARSPA